MLYGKSQLAVYNVARRNVSTIFPSLTIIHTWYTSLLLSKVLSVSVNDGVVDAGTPSTIPDLHSCATFCFPPTLFLASLEKRERTLSYRRYSGVVRSNEHVLSVANSGRALCLCIQSACEGSVARPVTSIRERWCQTSFRGYCCTYTTYILPCTYIRHTALYEVLTAVRSYACYVPSPR